MKRNRPVVIIPAEVYERMVKVVRQVGMGTVYRELAYSPDYSFLKPLDPVDIRALWEEAFNLLPEIGRDDDG